MNGYQFLEPEALARVKNLSMIARGVVEGFITGLHSSPYKGFSVEFAEHREYTPGDDPRHLDYRMLARTERLYVKQYEEETNMRVRILLDASGSMGYNHASELTKLRYGCYLSAILSYLMIRQQDQVGLTSFDSKVGLDLPAGSSPRHFHLMMEQLDQLKVGKETDIADTLHRMAERFKRRSLIVLISDLFDDLDAVIRALHHFRHQRHEVIVFHVLDRAELEFPFDDLTLFRDMETKQQLEVDPVFIREAYVDAVTKFVDRYRRACSECGIDYVSADTSTPYDFMLSRYIAKRGMM